GHGRLWIGALVVDRRFRARVENPCHGRRTAWHGFETRAGEIDQPGPRSLRLRYGDAFVGEAAVFVADDDGVAARLERDVDPAGTAVGNGQDVGELQLAGVRAQL